MISLRVFVCAFLFVFSARAATAPNGNEMAMNFLRGQVERIERNAAAAMEDFKTEEGRERRRQEALEMFGLSPMPERGDLKATITGRHERDGVVVENLHFQSSPGLYVTANFYLPAKVEGKLPTILYLCGHAVVKTNGVSYGNKVGYQHHGAWFAKHGYACLLIDTIQLGEIEGLHHGTNREGMWWWNSRGYSPAGVEAWNSMRALDYLETRPEVDKEKFGVTGRSGGGAYSWSLVALDSRVKAAAPVAGITDLRNHVIDGVVEGHCDCMYFVNTYGWDYPMLAALAAPRPLLIVNTDSDTIFPLDGVVRTHRYVAEIYKSLKQSSKLGLVIGPGPHKDTQDIQVPVFRWFNQHLKGEDILVEEPARKLFTGQELKVFDKIPEDQRVTNVHEWFIPKAPSQPKIQTQAEWEKQRVIWMTALREKVFRNAPQSQKASELKRISSEKKLTLTLSTFEFATDESTTARIYRLGPTKAPKDIRRVLVVVDHREWAALVGGLHEHFPKSFEEELPKAKEVQEKLLPTFRIAEVWFFPPREVGIHISSGEAKTRTHLARRFMLAGTTLDSMRVRDIGRAITTLGQLDQIEGTGMMAVNAVLASILGPDSGKNRADLVIYDLPPSIADAGDYLNIMRFIDIPELLALAAERFTVYGEAEQFQYANQLKRKFGWK